MNMTTATEVECEPEDFVARKARAEVAEWDRRFEERQPNAESIDFLLTPFVLERCIAFGMLVSAESFVFTMAVVPIRALLGLGSALLHGLYSLRRPTLGFVARADLVRVALVLFALACVWRLDLGGLAKLVKLSEIKLKMVWMCLEFLDKVLSSFGEAVLGSLLWILRCREPHRKWSLTTHTVIAALYLSVHCALLLVHLSVLNVAIGSGNSTLLSLVILVQFAEMKSIASKQLDREKLSAQCDEDITERFQLLLLVGLLFVHNFPGSASTILPRVSDSSYADRNVGDLSSLLLGLAILYGSELIVDWVKHTAIANTNGVLPGFYVAYTRGLARDCLTSAGWRASPFVDESLALADRVGLSPLPLVVITIKIAKDGLSGSPLLACIATVTAGWICLLCLRVFLRALLSVCAHHEMFTSIDAWLQLRDNVPTKDKKKDK